VPIEGAPPDPYAPVRGCPFAPRCAWRIGVCWTNNPPLLPSVDGAVAVHAVACHNPVNAAEALKGRPLRAGFAPTPTAESDA